MTAIPTTSRSSEGFTLVEMLMAMLIMTVGLLGLLQSVSVAYQQGLRDRVRQEAVQVAEARMHDWRRMGFDAITANGRTTVERLMSGVPRLFEVEWEQKGMGNSKRLMVAVAWSIKGETFSHEIYTVATK